MAEVFRTLVTGSPNNGKVTIGGNSKVNVDVWAEEENGTITWKAKVLSNGRYNTLQGAETLLRYGGIDTYTDYTDPAYPDGKVVRVSYCLAYGHAAVDVQLVVNGSESNVANIMKAVGENSKWYGVSAGWNWYTGGDPLTVDEIASVSTTTSVDESDVALKIIDRDLGAITVQITGSGDGSGGGGDDPSPSPDPDPDNHIMWAKVDGDWKVVY